MPDYAGVRFPGRNDIRGERQKPEQKYKTYENSEKTACLIALPTLERELLNSEHNMPFCVDIRPLR